MKKLVMLGPQASGKGTQANLLSEHFDVPHISTGDILRQNLKDMTELGRVAKSYINKGQLVPDDVINKVIEKRLLKTDARDGFILDGYPRNVDQAEFLDERFSLDKVILIDVSDEEAVKRISGRRTCERCGQVYSIYQEGMDLNNVCKSCGGQLVIRDDDREETVRKRLRIYHDETEPVVEHYKKRKLLLRIPGERPIKKIFEKIIKKI